MYFKKKNVSFDLNFQQYHFYKFGIKWDWIEYKCIHYRICYSSWIWNVSFYFRNYI